MALTDGERSHKHKDTMFSKLSALITVVITAQTNIYKSTFRDLPSLLRKNKRIWPFILISSSQVYTGHVMFVKG